MASDTKSKYISKPLKVYIAMTSQPSLDTMAQLLLDAKYQPILKKKNKSPSRLQKQQLDVKESCLKGSYPSAPRAMQKNAVKLKIIPNKDRSSSTKITERESNKKIEKMIPRRRIPCLQYFPATRNVQRHRTNSLMKENRASSPKRKLERNYRQRTINTWTSKAWLKYSEIKQDRAVDPDPGDKTVDRNSSHTVIDKRDTTDQTVKDEDSNTMAGMKISSTDSLTRQGNGNSSSWKTLKESCERKCHARSESPTIKRTRELSSHIPNHPPIQASQKPHTCPRIPIPMARRGKTLPTLEVSKILLEPVSQFPRSKSTIPLPFYAPSSDDSFLYPSRPSTRAVNPATLRISSLDKHLVGKCLVVDEPDIADDKLRISGGPVKRNLKNNGHSFMTYMRPPVSYHYGSPQPQSCYGKGAQQRGYSNQTLPSVHGNSAGNTLGHSRSVDHVVGCQPQSNNMSQWHVESSSIATVGIQNAHNNTNINTIALFDRIRRRPQSPIGYDYEPESKRIMNYLEPQMDNETRSFESHLPALPGDTDDERPFSASTVSMVSGFCPMTTPDLQYETPQLFFSTFSNHLTGDRSQNQNLALGEECVGSRQDSGGNKRDTRSTITTNTADTHFLHHTRMNEFSPNLMSRHGGRLSKRRPLKPQSEYTSTEKSSSIHESGYQRERSTSPTNETFDTFEVSLTADDTIDISFMS